MLVAIALTAVVWVLAAHRSHDILTVRHLQNAVFGPQPVLPGPVGTTRAQIERLRSIEGPLLLESVLPDQAGVLWLFALVVCLIGFAGPPGRAELAGLLALGLLLFDITSDLSRLDDPVSWQLMDWTFTAIVALSVALAGAAIFRSRRHAAGLWRPPVTAPTLRAAAVTLLALSLAITLIRFPDDAGFYTNLGAQRLRERGWFPYGDPVLSGSAAAGYGPVLFLVHLPFQALLDPTVPNPASPEYLQIRYGHNYLLPPAQASQLATASLHLLAVGALWLIVRRQVGSAAAWGVLALYLASPFVLGVGGVHESIGGVTFISHVAPTALALLALALEARPLWAGFALAASVATVFAPLFFVPAWVGYYAHDRRALARFVAGLALAAVIIGGPVLWRTRPIPGRSVIATVVHDTVGHHQGADMYGQSPFGFWGGRDGWRARLRNELVPGVSVSSPMFAAALAFMVSGAWLGRGRTPRQLAALMAAMGIASQLWKIHGTGVYVNWYLPFLLIGIYGADGVPGPSAPVQETHR
ncbi:hypothetical protein TBR22_A25040 [Luteitalea sp. TBR-22]|nr:hypothetical protein TBR22_A25040 [Luteitalea sp. TBR-22]